MELADRLLSLLIFDVDDLVFRIDSVAVVVKGHLPGFALNVARLQIVEYSFTYTAGTRTQQSPTHNTATH